jgi:Cu(I)/Ag(I) efflux system membrane protein CusA/SilA
LRSLPNISEVASVGGYEKEFPTFINPYKLYQYKIELQDIVKSIEESNIIGYITYTPSLRMGVADYNGQGEVVEGIVILRYQSDTYKTMQLIKQKINEISKNLKDITIIPVYDRSILIEETIKGLFKDITKEMIITIAVVLIFLYSIRGSVIILFFILFSTLIGLFIFNLN